MMACRSFRSLCRNQSLLQRRPCNPVALLCKGAPSRSLDKHRYPNSDLFVDTRTAICIMYGLKQLALLSFMLLSVSADPNKTMVSLYLRLLY